MKTHFDNSAVDDFWKHSGKRRNCSWWLFSPFTTMFSTILNKRYFSCRDFCLDIFRDAADLLFVGNGSHFIWSFVFTWYDFYINWLSVSFIFTTYIYMTDYWLLKIFNSLRIKTFTGLDRFVWRSFQQFFSHIKAASSPSHVFPVFFGYQYSTQQSFQATG